MPDARIGDMLGRAVMDRMKPPPGPGRRWSLDVVGDALVGRRRFRVLAVVDDLAGEGLALAIVPDETLLGPLARPVRFGAPAGRPHPWRPMGT